MRTWLEPCRHVVDARTWRDGEGGQAGGAHRRASDHANDAQVGQGDAGDAIEGVGVRV
jgi:hypothetical protein